MARFFISKEIDLTTEVEERLRAEFRLDEDDLNDIEKWNDSGYSGTIINTDPISQFKCYPYPYPITSLKNDYPDCKIWE